MKLNVNSLLFGTVNNLSHISRFSSASRIRSENVAEHSYYVCLYSMLIAEDLKSKYKDIDFRKLYKRCVLHDIDESISGDIIRSFKYSTVGLRREIEKATKKNVAVLEKSLGMEIYKYWEEAKSFDKEGRIIALADLLSVLSYCVSEYWLGNISIMPVLRECCKWVRKGMSKSKDRFNQDLLRYIKQIDMYLSANMLPTIEGGSDV